MQLIHASAHKMTTKYGEEVEYVRLGYRTKRGILGQSVLIERASPDLRNLARSGRMNSRRMKGR